MISLTNILRDSVEGRKYIERLNNLRKFAKKKLKEIKELFPKYTKHNIEHSDKIITNLNIIIPDGLKKALNEYEIYFLLCSAYLHDIGMALLKDELNDPNIEELENEKEKLKSYIRDNHHLRSENYVKQNFANLSIENHHQAAIIGELCKGHRRVDLSKYETEFIYNHDSINIALLALFLRIADELDITYNRIPLINGELVFPEDEVSREYWETHLAISGISKKKSDPLVIKCSARCSDSKIHRTLKRLEAKINKEIFDLPKLISHYNSYIGELPRYCSFDIKPEDYEPIDFKFTLEGREILNYLINQLYTEPDVAIRELLKNSIDACRAKKQICDKEGRIYTPKIKFILINDKKELVIQDNGIGMSKDSIENFLTKIGKSYYTSPEFRSLELDFTPVSELGIGMLSNFLICNQFSIDTKTDDNKAIKVEIKDIDDYFIVYESKRKDTGTTIILKLKDEISEIIDTSIARAYGSYPSGKELVIYYRKLYLDEIVRRYARHIEFPIDLIFDISHESIEDIGYELVFVPKDYYVYPIRIDEEFAQGIIAIHQKNPETGLKAVSFSEYNAPQFNYSVSYEGIYINEVRFIFRKISFRIVKYDLNLKNNSVALNISRDFILNDEKFYTLCRKIEKIILDNIPTFLNGYIDYLVKLKIDSKPNIHLFINEYFIYPLDNIHKEIIEEYYYFKIIKNGQIEYVNYNEIQKFEDNLCILEGVEDLNDEELKEKIKSWEELDKSSILIVKGRRNPPLETYFKDVPVIRYTDEKLDQ